MTQKNLAYYYTKARKEGWAIPQFNWSTPEMLKGIVRAAVSLKSPLLLGTSEGDSEFVGLRQAAVLVEAWREDTGLPIFLNLDHGKSFEYLKDAIDVGYDAVHFDGSKLDLQENIEITKKVVAYAKEKNISIVEGEVGHVMGGSSLHQEKTINLDTSKFTSVEDAQSFVKATNVDSLAITFGNVHGVYEDMPKLDLERLKKIENKVESALVLHGGSGIVEEQVLEAIKLGIVKINISTELRAAYIQTLRKSLQGDSYEVTPYKLLGPSIDAVQKVAEEKIKLFKCYL